MIGFSGLVASHARSIVVIALAFALAGIAAGLSLPVGLFPQVAFPRVVISLDAGSRPADQMALLVTRPVEEAVRTVPGVVEVRSDTSRGSAQVSVDFGWNREMVSSTLLIVAPLAQVLPGLPSGTAYSVRRLDPTVFPIISYALQSDSVSPIALRDFAQFQIVPLLASIDGLARVDVHGGAMGHRCGAQHHRPHGNDDDCRHRHGDVDLLRLRIQRACTGDAAASGAACGQSQSPASDQHDN